MWRLPSRGSFYSDLKIVNDFGADGIYDRHRISLEAERPAFSAGGMEKRVMAFGGWLQGDPACRVAWADRPRVAWCVGSDDTDARTSGTDATRLSRSLHFVLLLQALAFEF